ncbi:MAG: hypothetical protein AAGA29_07230 [Planctomycetota bacterium]
MTAIAHHNAITPVSPTADVLADPLHTLSPSRTERRRDEVDRAAAEIIDAAEDAGWIVTRDRAFSNGASRYFDTHLSSGVAVTLRVADHCPSRALGVAGDRPFVLAIVSTPGGLAHAKTWLARMAEQVGRVQHGQTHQCRLRKAVA